MLLYLKKVINDNHKGIDKRRLKVKWHLRRGSNIIILRHLKRTDIFSASVE